MQRYDFVLLDADETLFDFTRAQQIAFCDTFQSLGLDATEENLLTYSAINQFYWRALERGEVTKKELGARRFQDLFAALGVRRDPHFANDLYAASLSEADYLLDGALEVCALLARHCTLAIVTNGMVATQKRRVQKSPLARYVSHLIVSEEAGAAKPDPRIFAHTFDRCGIQDPDRVLMVGDSLSADVAGAINFGIDACWFNRLDLPVPANWKIRAVISDLAGLPAIVFGER